MLLEKEVSQAPFALWCLARIGARELVYGGAEEVVHPSVSERWLDTLLEQEWHERAFMERCVVSLARCTGDRQRDLTYSFRERVARRLKKEGMQPDFIKSVEEPTEILEEETQKILGDSLPDGLRMII